MLKKRIIPCLDVKNGRTVKGVNFVDLQDAGDPVEQATIYDQAGADELCFLDITATHEGRNTFRDMVQKVAEKCFMPLTVGGGVGEASDVGKLLKSGADKVSINSAAIRNPDIIAQAANKYGNQCIVISVDVKRVGTQFECFTHGGRKETGIEAIGFIEQMVANGAGEVLLTSMDADGTKQGFDIELVKKVVQTVNVPIIASGGVGTKAHFVEGAEAGADGLLAASVFHFGELTIPQVKKYMHEQGVATRV